MQSGLYVNLSAQMALQTRMETIAHNVANVSTAGFRAEEVRFEQLLSRASDEPIAFAGTGETYIARRAGSLTKTGNPFDVAVKGDGWLSIAATQGQAYTRDGRMQMTPSGDLKTLNGHAVLDVGGAPIQLDPTAGPPSIANDGAITQNGRRTGVIGLFSLDPQAKLRRFENSAVFSNKPASPVLEFGSNGVAQGYSEGANINPVAEISKLITVSRTFEAISSAIGMTENTYQEGIRALGGSS